MLRTMFSRAWYVNRTRHGSGCQILVVDMPSSDEQAKATQKRYERLFGDVGYFRDGFENYVSHALMRVLRVWITWPISRRGLIRRPLIQRWRILREIKMLDETKQLVALLPYSMRERARGYMDFVNDVLYSVSLEENAHEQRREIQYEVEMVFMLKLLYAVFVTGYRNFTQVLEFLDGKGASGFEIGARFIGRTAT